MAPQPTDGPFCCPACTGALVAAGPGSWGRCTACDRQYACDGGIPLLYWSEDGTGGSSESERLTQRVRSFYEEYPFPDYEELESTAGLAAKARRGVFARLLDEGIPATARVLEVGCGTGQLGNFLALCPARTVISTDVSLASLRLGQAFKASHGIDACTFAQMNLFRPALFPESFDLVICTGVLHHTGAPRRGFRSIARLVAPGGYVVLGLYHRVGRVGTRARRILLRLGGDRLAGIDPRIRREPLGSRRRRAWILDQYHHPHESTHTFGEVLEWLAGEGFEFVGSVPPTRAFVPFSDEEGLFSRQPLGNGFERLLVQLAMMVAGAGEGGLFVVVARRGREAHRCTS